MIPIPEFWYINLVGWVAFAVYFMGVMEAPEEHPFDKDWFHLWAGLLIGFVTSYGIHFP